MGDSAHKTEALDEIAIDFEERFGFFRFTRESARREYSALMRGVERRRAIGVSFGEGNTALGNHPVDLIDRPRNQCLKQPPRLLLADLPPPVPHLVVRLPL